MLYTVAVDEVVSKRRLYMVEANSKEDALYYAEMGDTTDELDLNDGEVIERVVDTKTLRTARKGSL